MNLLRASGSIVVLLFLGACQKASPLVGSWKSTLHDETYVLSLRRDGSFVLNVSLAGHSNSMFGSYSSTPDSLVLAPYNPSEPQYPLKFEILTLGDAEINLRKPPDGEILTFMRIAKDPGTMPASEVHARTPAGQADARESNQKRRDLSVDKAIFNAARWLAAAADQYYLENGVTFVSQSELVGPTKYIKALNTSAGETFPSFYTQHVTITITGVAGARTLTYSP